MRVELPDGTVLDDVPDGTTREQLTAKLQANGYDVSKLGGAPAAPKKEPDSLMSRIGTGLADPIHGAAQIMDKAIVDPIRQVVSPGASSMADVTKQRDAEYNAPEGVDWGRVGGNIANPVSWVGGGAGGLATKIASKLPQTLSGAAGRTVAAGAGQAALGPVGAENYDDNFLATKASDMAVGAGVGAAGKVLTKSAGGLVTPTAGARTLMDEGVHLTPGQAAGKNSRLNTIEQWTASGPGGLIINPARKVAGEEASIAAAKSVSDLVDKQVKLGTDPKEAVALVRDTVSKTYDDALEGIKVPAADTRKGINQFVTQVGKKHPMMDRKELGTMTRFLDTRLLELQRRGVKEIDGPMAKQLDSEIGKHIRDLRGSTDMSAKTAVDGWLDLQQQFRETMALHQPDAAKTEALNAANGAYRQLLALEKARPKGADGFTPRQLKATLERMDIKGTKLNRVSEAMSDTLPNTVPNSGTAERTMFNQFIGGLTRNGNTGVAGGLVGAVPSLVAGTVLGSKAGANVLTGNNAAQRFAKRALSPHEDKIAAIMAAATRGQ